MAKHFTGIDGSLRVDGTQVAKLSEWSFTAETSTLETTSLGDFARTYVPGIQSFSGTSTAYYYVTSSNTVDGGALLEDVIRTGAPNTVATHTILLRLSDSTNREVEFKCVVTSVSISCRVGDLVTASIAFTASGALTKATLGS
jgi:hypothetical protein|tara:strand:- start:4275 stop:4703 length:429 start_codon:yes stop_codon:yes gene_type:complete